MNLEIVQYPNDVLRQQCEKIEKNDKEVRKILGQMKKYVKNPLNGALGIALPQVGITKQGFIFRKGRNVEIVINPKILKASEDCIAIEEGCLSIEGASGRVNRRREIIVSYRDFDWKLQEFTLKDLDSIVFQHEYDHLKGKLFIDYLKDEEK